MLLAGARPSRSVRRLAGPGVEVTGWMPDIRDAYARASVMVAPLFIGAGLQNKILEAMAMGVPCVTTTLVNDSIGAERGREIMVADNPADLAQATAELLESPGRRAEISEAARAMVIDRFSWGAVGDKLTSIFERR
ncbi:MAG: glycosyltransferase [Microthrixaceae bacterium]